MITEQSEHIIREVSKAFIGKDDIIRRVLMTVYAGGHILLEDSPGVGKTTLALAFSRAMGLDFKRIQFTPDTLPADITGFSMFNRQINQFEYREGAAVCNLLLADEINCTSPKTQAALLEVMEEHHVTVDGITHPLPDPFICIATQNPLGTAGTQILPESQLDRFMVRLSIGYPTMEDQIRILKSRRFTNPLDEILQYIIRLCEETRKLPLVELGISPRGVYALTQMVKAHAVLESRSYVIPEDVQDIFIDMCAHRLVLRPQARVEGVTEQELLRRILVKIRPSMQVKGWHNG